HAQERAYTQTNRSNQHRCAPFIDRTAVRCRVSAIYICARLHLLEQMRELAAHRDFLLAALERQGQMPEFIALRERDVLRIDHGTAVNLPEDFLVELLEQFAQRHTNDA